MAIVSTSKRYRAVEFDISRLDRREVIKICRDTFGDTDPYTPFTKRTWYTLTDTLHITEGNESTMSWLLLKGFFEKN